MNDLPYSENEKKLAKRLKKIAADEGVRWKHGQCLRIVRRFRETQEWRRHGERDEELAARIFIAEQERAA